MAENNQFGIFLRALRKLKRMTQQDLATLSGVTKVSICNLETGKNKPQSKTIAKLSKALECDYETLYNKLR